MAGDLRGMMNGISQGQVIQATQTLNNYASILAATTDSSLIQKYTTLMQQQETMLNELLECLKELHQTDETLSKAPQ